MSFTYAVVNALFFAVSKNEKAWLTCYLIIFHLICTYV
ncbi:hypothetical protein I600_2153 [Maribacter dokdonensis DSW-8]|nr:hypothetical protein I600_2153 [Maribacter dokdonensis DSW-8]